MRGDYGDNSSVEKLSRGNNMLIKVKEYQTARSGARTEKKLRKTSPNQFGLLKSSDLHKIDVSS